MPALGGDQQGRAPVTAGLVDVDAGVEQQPGRRHVALLGREQQRREPAVRAGPHVRAGDDEGRSDAVVLLRDRPHQRGLPAHRLPVVHAGATGKQALYGIHVAGPGAGHEGRDAGRQRLAGVRAMGQQPVHNRGAAVGAGQGERCDPEFVLCVGVGARAEKDVRHLEVVAVHGPVKRCRAVRLRRVYRRLGLDERTDRRGVLATGCLDERQPVLTRSGVGPDEE